MCPGPMDSNLRTRVLKLRGRTNFGLQRLPSPGMSALLTMDELPETPQPI